MSIRPAKKFTDAAAHGDIETVRAMLPTVQKKFKMMSAAVTAAIENRNEGVLSVLLSGPVSVRLSATAANTAMAADNTGALAQLLPFIDVNNGMLIKAAARLGRQDAFCFLLDRAELTLDAQAELLVGAVEGANFASDSQPIFDLACKYINARSGLKAVLQHSPIPLIEAASSGASRLVTEWVQDAHPEAPGHALHWGYRLSREALVALAKAASPGVDVTQAATQLAAADRLAEIEDLLAAGHHFSPHQAMVYAAKTGSLDVMAFMWARLSGTEDRDVVFATALEATVNARFNHISSNLRTLSQDAAIDWLLSLADPLPGQPNAALLAAIRTRQSDLVDRIIPHCAVNAPILRQASTYAESDLRIVTRVFSAVPTEKLSQHSQALVGASPLAVRDLVASTIDSIVLRSAQAKIQPPPPKKVSPL